MKLFEQWQENKESLLDGMTGSKRAILDQLFENQKTFVTETMGDGTVAGAIANFQKVVFPMLRRVVPGTISMDLVGVQPMTGPVGLIYTQRWVYGKAADGNGAAQNDISAGDEMFANNSKMKRFYSTSNVGTTGYPPALTATTSTGLAGATADFEGYGGRDIRMEILKKTITAGSRKLQARWTPEAAQDLAAQHNLNMENQITAALAAQLAHDIDNEILTDLLGLAATVGTYDFANPMPGFAPAYVGDRFAELGVLVDKMAQEIGAKTRMGTANWLVGSYFINSILRSASKSVFAPAVQGTFGDANGNKLVGTLNGSMKCYSYNWGLNDAWGFTGNGNATGTTLNDGGEDILLGFKGNSEVETGFVYAPYLPVTSTGVVMDANTFTPAVSLSTRYAKAKFDQTSDSLGNSADFYARIRVTNVRFS
jgi:hypothetical protein